MNLLNRTTFLYGALAAAAVLIVWHEYRADTPRTFHYQDPALGFSLELPVSWRQGITAASSAATRTTVFTYHAVGGEASDLLTLVATSDPSQVPYPAYLVRELGKRGSDTYLATWLSGNPLSGAAAARWFERARQVPGVLDSFQLTPAPVHAAAVGPSSGCQHSFAGFPAGSAGSPPAGSQNYTTHPGARQFQSAIARAIGSGKRFAERYAVVEWGCGTLCQEHAVVEATSGRIIAFGLPTVFGVAYEAGSSLMVLNPSFRAPLGTLVPAGTQTTYYALTGGVLTQLCELPLEPLEPV